MSEHVQVLVGEVEAEVSLLASDEETGVLQAEFSSFPWHLLTTEKTQLPLRRVQTVALLPILPLLLLLLVRSSPVYIVGVVVVAVAGLVVVGLGLVVVVLQGLFVVSDIPHHLVLVVGVRVVMGVMEGFEEREQPEGGESQ